MKRKRKWPYLLGVPVVAVVLVVACGIFWIDHIAKAAVEAGGTYALGVDTTLEDMDIGLLSGSLAMADLNVANPDGFETPHFLHLGRGSLAVSLGSLRTQSVRVPELALSRLNVNLENKAGRSNYKVILDGMKKSQAEPAEAKPESTSDKKFVIEHVLIEDVHVQVDLLPVGGKLSRTPIRIERIELRDLGSDTQGGVALAELTRILTQAILTAVTRRAGDILPADITRELNAGLAGLGDVSFQVLGDVTTLVDGQAVRVAEIGRDLLQRGGKDTEAVLKDAEKTLKEGLGGLLKKKNDKNDNP